MFIARAPAVILANNPGTSVTFSNVKWGEMNSTWSVGPSGYYQS